MENDRRDTLMNNENEETGTEDLREDGDNLGGENSNGEEVPRFLQANGREYPHDYTNEPSELPYYLQDVEPEEDMPAIISMYDDHAASAGSDGLVYAYLCEECAEKRGIDVTRLSTCAAGEPLFCDECCRPNRDEVEEEEKDY